MCNQNYWQMGSLANKDFSLSTETMVWDLVWERPGWRGLYINGSTTSRWGLGRELWRPWLWGPERPVAPRQLGPWRFAATYCPPPPCPALSLHLPLHCWSVEASTEPALTLASMPRLSHVRTDLRVWSQRTRNTDSPPHPALRRWHELWQNLLSPLSWGLCPLDKCPNMRRCIFEACPPEFVWLLINIRPGSFCKRCDASMFNFRLTSFEYSDFDQLVKALMLAFYCVGMKLMWLWNISHLSSLWLWTEWMKRRRGKNWSVA